MFLLRINQKTIEVQTEQSPFLGEVYYEEVLLSVHRTTQDKLNVMRERLPLDKCYFSAVKHQKHQEAADNVLTFLSSSAVAVNSLHEFNLRHAALITRLHVKHAVWNHGDTLICARTHCPSPSAH